MVNTRYPWFWAVRAVALGGSVFSSSVVSAGAYDIQIRLDDTFTDAVVYANLFDFPGSAVAVDEAGAIAVGDPFSMVQNIEVSADGTASWGGVSGLLPNGFTFGNPSVPPQVTAVLAERNGSYLTVGEFATGFDVITARWFAGDDGVDGHNVASMILDLTLFGEAGTLVGQDGRLLAGDLEEFRSLVTGAHVRLSYPAAFSYDAFIVDPDFVIVPGAGALAPLLLAGVALSGRRRSAGASSQKAGRP